MNASLTVHRCELEWQEFVRRDGNSGFNLLTICGPSGVGKSTAARTLARNYPVYLENAEGNPYLPSLLECVSEFHAAANQEWFLHRIRKHIAEVSPQTPLILDQDPAAIVLAYARMYMDDGKISEAQYISLLRQLLEIERLLRRWKSPRTVLCLDAPADVLRQRVIQRLGARHTQPLMWFEKLRNHFAQFFERLPNAIIISTLEMLPDEVISRAVSLIKDSADDTQA